MTRRPTILHVSGRRRWSVVAAGAMLAAALGVAVNEDARTAVRDLAVATWDLPVSTDNPNAATLDTNAAESGPLPETSAPPTLYWRPPSTLTWQWLPAGTVDLTRPVDVYNLDPAATTPATTAAIHDQGAHVICRIQAGKVDRTSRHAGTLDPTAIGNPVPGRPQERYLDLARLDALRPYISAQLDDCWTRGFDAVDAVGVDTPTTTGPDAIGFPVTSAHEIALVRMVSALAHARGLAMGLHLGPVTEGVSRAEFVAAVEPVTDFAVVERCLAVGESCADAKAFTDRGKAVLHLEYVDDYPGATTAAPQPALNHLCPQVKPLGFSSILKDRSGTTPAWRASCN